MAWKLGQELPLMFTEEPHLSKQNKTDCSTRVFQPLSRKDGLHMACTLSSHMQ